MAELGSVVTWLDLRRSRCRSRYKQSKSVASTSSSKLSSQAIDFQILRLLIQSENTRHFKARSMLSCFGKLVGYAHGKLLIRNNRTKTIDCYSAEHLIRSNQDNPRKLWSILADPKWEDHIVIRSFQHFEYEKPSLLVLRTPGSTSNSFLERIDLSTGNRMEKIPLLDNTRFTELSHDDERNWIVVKSAKISRSAQFINPELMSSTATTNTDPDAVLYLLLLTKAPIMLLHKIDIKKSVYGRGITDAMISHGLLLVQGSKGLLRFYCIDSVINHSVLFCLREIRSHSHYLQINENPWVYITSESATVKTVRRLSDDSTMGRLTCWNDSDVDPVAFLPDNSGRILVSGSVLQVYTTNCPVGQSSPLEKVFEMAVQDRDEQKKEQFTRSGRRISANYAAASHSDQSEAFSTWCYEDELDTIAVVIFEDITDETDDESERGVVASSIGKHVKELRLLSGSSLMSMRTIPLGMLVYKPGMVASEDIITVFVDLDVIIIVIKNDNNHLYIQTIQMAGLIEK